MPARRVRYVWALLLIGSVPAAAQDPAGPLPPIPTGAALPPLPGQEPRGGVVPAGLFDAPPAPFLDGPPRPGTSVTGCHFDAGCGANIFAPDGSTSQVLVGAYFSGKPGPPIPRFDYVPVTFRRGWMLTAPADDGGWWRGNLEVLADLTVASITSDYGNVFGGPSLLLRYNFVQPGAALVPYAQGGAGFVLNDAYRDRSQQAVGAFFEFYLHLEVGLKYFVSKNWSVDVEGGFQHISNADTAGRNAGVNAAGVQVGFTYYFPAGGR